VTRIVAGSHGGRRLSTPAGRDTRPTSDRVREALFSTLSSLIDLSGARVADLYAGSGAIGLEAASRGADSVLLVESERQAARVARANIEALRLGEVVILATTRVASLLPTGPPAAGGYHVVVADPPYALPESELQAVQEALLRHGWLAPEAVVVLERSARSPAVTWVPGLTGERSRRYGETILWYGRHS
jgi:16S rRNA (guanine966-N2)-methyltransferase